MSSSTTIDVSSAGPLNSYRIVAVRDHYAVEWNGMIVGVIEHLEPSGWQFTRLGGDTFYGGSVAMCMNEANRYAASRVY
jgi:hypothetical protein